MVGYLGPAGSYSCLAAKKMRPDEELVPYCGFPALIDALERGGISGAVVPIENALNGGVTQVMDLMQSHGGISASEECELEIDHRLVTLSGADVGGIERIFSHRQALEQCSRYLAHSFPKAQLIAVSSTAAGLDMVRSCSDACIAGAHTARAGLEVSPQNIADEKNNFTRFLYLVRGEIAEGAHSRRVYFTVTCRNVPGALLRLLEPVCRRGLNLTKIESRPIKDRRDEYRFFIEAEGDYASENVRSVLEEVKKEGSSFRLLGCY